jgi:hypothetical protein
VHQIAAVSGHASLKEVQRYTRGYDQARLAREAFGIPAQEQTVANGVKTEPAAVSNPLKALAEK